VRPKLDTAIKNLSLPNEEKAKRARLIVCNKDFCLFKTKRKAKRAAETVPVQLKNCFSKTKRERKRALELTQAKEKAE